MYIHYYFTLFGDELDRLTSSLPIPLWIASYNLFIIYLVVSVGGVGRWGKDDNQNAKQKTTTKISCWGVKHIEFFFIYWYWCWSMLINYSRQNRVSADQYHLTISRTQESTHRGRDFFEVIRWQVAIFQMIADSSLFIMKYVVFMSQWPRAIKILISDWPRTGKFSLSFTNTTQAGKTFSYHGHTFVTLYVQFLCSDWSKFDRWVHAEHLCSILKLVYFDSWSWQSFV